MSMISNIWLENWRIRSTLVSKLNCFTVLLVGFSIRIHFDFLLVTVSYFFYVYTRPFYSLCTSLILFDTELLHDVQMSIFVHQILNLHCRLGRLYFRTFRTWKNAIFGGQNWKIFFRRTHLWTLELLNTHFDGPKTVRKLCHVRFKGGSSVKL